MQEDFLKIVIGCQELVTHQTTPTVTAQVKIWRTYHVKVACTVSKLTISECFEEDADDFMPLSV